VAGTVSGLCATAPRVDGRIGDLSYPVYLVHYLFAWPVLVLVGSDLAAPTTFAVSCAVGAVIILMVDRPLEALRARLRRGGRRTAVSAYSAPPRTPKAGRAPLFDTFAPRRRPGGVVLRQIRRCGRP
jgi:peptidoglycan/LPS O-acetylase OafA/YrhL